MLSKHGLYPHQGASLIPAKNSLDYLDVVLWVLFYSDGKHSVKQLKDELNIDSETIDSICSKLVLKNIIEKL